MDVKELLDHFPYDKPRESQKYSLEAIADTWDDTDVYVLTLPVAAGKTALAYCLQSYLLSEGSSTGYIVPSNALRDQAIEEFPELRTVKRMDEYWLEKYNMSEAEFREKHYKWGPKGSQYNEDLKAVKRVGTKLIANYFTYMAHKLQRKNVIIDEAHKMLETLREIHAKTVWRHECHYPEYIRSVGELKEWADEQPLSNSINALKQTLVELEPSTIVHQTQDEHYGELKDCIKLLPLSVKGKPEFYWPAKTQKIFLMSATISRLDVEYMGLAGRRVTYIDCGSDIPVENRPIKPLNTASMAYKNQETSLPLIAAKIQEVVDSKPNENIFIHATYSIAKKLRAYLTGDRYLFHTNNNKSEILQKFKESKGRVMIGSGLYEGISLSYDQARIQIVTKVPFPSLTDPAMRWIMRNKSEYYSWLTAIDLLQASGRVCRNVDDYGETLILDSSWQRWYNNSKDILPKWFTEAVVE